MRLTHLINQNSAYLCMDFSVLGEIRNSNPCQNCVVKIYLYLNTVLI